MENQPSRLMALDEDNRTIALELAVWHISRVVASQSSFAITGIDTFGEHCRILRIAYNMTGESWLLWIGWGDCNVSLRDSWFDDVETNDIRLVRKSDLVQTFIKALAEVQHERNLKFGRSAQDTLPKE